jgi:hypothetical protein
VTKDEDQHDGRGQQITLDLDEAPVHIDSRTLQAHNETDTSLMCNLTAEAADTLGWEAGDDVVVKLYKEEDSIQIERLE